MIISSPNNVKRCFLKTCNDNIRITSRYDKSFFFYFKGRSQEILVIKQEAAEKKLFHKIVDKPRKEAWIASLGQRMENCLWKCTKILIRFEMVKKRQFTLLILRPCYASDTLSFKKIENWILTTTIYNIYVRVIELYIADQNGKNSTWCGKLRFLIPFIL